MANQADNTKERIEDLLVAYLDGELDAEAGQRIEDLLASDPSVRETLQGLDRTWDLLSELDAPETGEQFVHSTLEMVAVAATEDAEQARIEVPRKRRRRWTIAVAGLAGAALVGFLTVALFAPDPNRQLVEDLPILEDLEHYRQLADDDIEFLQLLHQEGLFAEETPPQDTNAPN